MNPVQNKFLTLLLLLSACGPLVKIGDSGPAPQRFSLSAAPSETTAIAMPALRVETLDTSADLATTRIAVRVGQQEVRYLASGIWTDKPAQLLRNLLADHLRPRSTGVVLAANQLDVVTPFRISGRLTGFQAEGAAALATHASVSAELFILQGNKIIASRSFNRRRTLPSDRPNDVTASLNSAANDIAADAADWITATLVQTR
jgi:cholesterol transport system auxiliary component